MSEARLTPEAYWDAGYAHKPGASVDVRDFRQLGDRRIIERIEAMKLTGARVLEVGAGNSGILTYLARTHAGTAQFAGLDYSEPGCRMLSERAQREGAELSVYHQDLFEPSAELVGRFDRIYSLGVVEHFSELASVLAAKARLLAPGGEMFTLIPNMRGVVGRLTKRYNPTVYGVHIAHDMDSFLDGHRRAGLEVLSSGFLCSTNFGTLSSCFPTPDSPGWTTYKWLSRLSKALWYVESRTGDLPATAALSPYLVAVSRAQA